MSLWLAADSLALADNDPVATWPDLSGNGNDATQASSGSRPLFKAGILNGKGVVRFDGVDDFLQYATAIAFAAGAVFTVAKKIGSNGMIMSGSTNSQWRIRAATSISTTSTAGDDIQVAADMTAAFTLLAFDFDGVAEMIRQNGGALGGSAGARSYLFQVLGAYFDGSINVGADIAEILIYPTALSDPDREAVEAYLNNKYLIY